MSKSNHAIQISKTGGLEVIEFNQVDHPKPGPDEILIEAEWGGVNFSEDAIFPQH